MTLYRRLFFYTGYTAASLYLVIGVVLEHCTSYYLYFGVPYLLALVFLLLCRLLGERDLWPWPVVSAALILLYCLATAKSSFVFSARMFRWQSAVRWDLLLFGGIFMPPVLQATVLYRLLSLAARRLRRRGGSAAAVADTP